MAATVKFAVWGALRDGNPDKAEAEEVTGALQDAIDSSVGQVVKIDNTNMGVDPAKHVRKHFAAIVEVDGTDRAFACEEDQTIDFT
jgi:hypothetical protein